MMNNNHAHMHTHNHGHTHSHVLLWPIVLVTGFAIVEAVGGWLSGSLALLGDAGHMFSDAAALGLAAMGAWISRRPASQQHSFGLMRAEVIVALVNGLLMLLVIGAIVYEAIQRLQVPTPVRGAEVMVIAFIGFLVNVLVAWRLHHAEDNLNYRAAFLHVMGDLLGSVAALVAGAVIYFTGWLPIDPILSLFICVLILFSTLKLLAEALHVLMEGVPRHLNIDAVTAAMSAMPQVHEVHSVHIWALSSQVAALSAHVVLEDIQNWHEVLEDLRQVLHERYDIDHVTLQPETIQALNSGEVDCWLTRKQSQA